jgi:hypothetical protein
MYTVLIQGPIKNHRHVNMLYEHYTMKGGHVVIHTWDSDEAQKLEYPYTSLKLEEYNDIIKFNHPLSSNKILSSIYYHIKNVATAFDNFTSTMPVIKIRSDEYYSDLSEVVEYLLKNPNKLVCNNVFLRKQSEQPFNISDHLLGMSYNNMKNTYKTLHTFFDNFRLLTNQKDIFSEEVYESLWGKKYFGTQNLICRSFLMNLGYTKLDDINLVKENCHCIPVSELGDYIIMNNHKNERFDSIMGKSWPHNNTKYGENRIW